MGRAKEIILRVIPAKIAREFIIKHHYSGKIVNNSNLHFGAFLDGNLHGVLSFGSSTQKSVMLGIVKGTQWNEFIELNRMAFDDYLPRNSESRCLSLALKAIKKNAPQIKWVVSFADGCQCGDGTIYRAANFVLTGITKNKSMLLFPSGEIISQVTLSACWNSPIMKRQSKFCKVPHKYRTSAEWRKLGAEYLDGFMFRYIYFLDKDSRKRLTVPEIPFSKINEIGARMYKGKKL